MISWLRRTFIFFCTFELLLHPPLTSAQTSYGAVSGRVYDFSLAAIEGATLTYREVQTGVLREAKSQRDGSYRFEGLAPGEYIAEVSSPNFKTQLRSLTLRVGDHPIVDFRLEVGPIIETVEIHGDVSGIDSSSASVSGIVDRSQIQTIPLNGRNLLESARLEPGVSVLSVANPGAFGNNYQRVSLAGAPYVQTRVSVDGAAVNDRINGGTSQNFSQEMAQEFQISTFTFDLNTGNTGTGSVNIVSRRGGNDYRGAVFYQYRDNEMAAYPALQRSSGNLEPSFARRQSGFSMGGPFKENRFFWFTNFEHNNQDGVLAVANNDSIFSKLDVVYPTPLNFNLFNVRLDGNIGRFHRGFLRFSLDQNNNIASSSNGVFMPSNWQVSRSLATQGQGGLTSVLSPRLFSDVRFSYSYLSNHLDPVKADRCNVQPNCVGVGGPQLHISDVPQFRIGSQSTVPKTMLQRSAQLVVNMTWQAGAHRVVFGGEWERLQLNSVHSFFEQPQTTLWGPTELQRSAAALFDALPETLKDPLAPAPTAADILKLPLRSFTLGIGDPLLPGRYHHDQASQPNLLRLHLQDGWTVRRDLTLSFGLGYSYRTHVFNDDLKWPAYLKPLFGKDPQLARRNPSNFESRFGIAWSPGSNRTTVFRGGGGVFQEELNFFNSFLERGPLGPAGNGRVMIDGAVAGLSFMSAPTSYKGEDLLSDVPGLRSTLMARLGDGTNPAIQGIEVLKQGDRLFDPQYELPYAIHLSAGLQRQLPSGMVLTADYVLRRFLHFGGYQSVSQLDRNRFNRPRVTSINPNTGVVSFVRDPVIPLCSAAQATALVPADQCSTGPINVFGSDANYRYEGLHLKLNKRFTSRLQLTASYALARNTGWVEFTEYDNFASGYGNVADSRRHRLTLSGYYELPRYAGESRLLKGLVNNWSVALISQTDSAPPLNTLLAGLDLDGDGISRTLLPGTTRHNTFGAGLDESRLRELVAQYNADVEARTRRVVNADGTTTVVRPRTPFNQVITPITLPKRISPGDSFITQDVRLIRSIQFANSRRLLLIGDVFNIFNVSNLSGYNNVLNQSNYGQPSTRAAQVFGSGGPRAFQFAVRVEF